MQTLLTIEIQMIDIIMFSSIECCVNDETLLWAWWNIEYSERSFLEYA